MFFENWSRRSLSLTTWWGQQKVCERAPSSSKYLLKVNKILLAQIGNNCRLGINFIHLYSYLIFWNCVFSKAKAKNFLYRSRRILMFSPIQAYVNIYFCEGCKTCCQQYYFQYMLIFVITDIENDPFMPNNETDLYHIRACLKGMRLPCPFHFHVQLTITLAFYFNFPPTNNLGDSPLDGNTRHSAFSLALAGF